MGNSVEGGQAGLGAAEYEGVDVVRALVGIDGFQVHHMSHDVVLVMDAVAAVHVSRDPRNGKRLAAVVSFDEADHFGRGLVLVKQSPDPQAGLQAKADFSLHIDKLDLDKLVAGEGLTKLFALQRVLTGGMPAKFCCTHDPPGNAIACLVEAGEGPLEALDVGEHVGLRNLDIVHHDFARDRGPKAELSLNAWRGEALHAALKNEAAD